MTWTIKPDTFSGLYTILDGHTVVAQDVGKANAERIMVALELLDDYDLACNLAQGVQNDAALRALLAFDFRALQGKLRRAKYTPSKVTRATGSDE